MGVAVQGKGDSYAVHKVYANEYAWSFVKNVFVIALMCARARVCVRACVRACVRVCILMIFMSTPRTHCGRISS